MSFDRVGTLADLDLLDSDEIVRGYLDWRAGDPEPGPNRGRAYWHGWRVRAMDAGSIEIDAEHRALASAYYRRSRSVR